MSATVTVSKIKVDKRPYIAKTLVKWFNKGKLDFKNVIQRNEVWSESNKSLFIHSLLMRFPFMPVMAQDVEDDVLSILDGKQRLTTTINYMLDKFPLHKDTPFYLDMDIAGKKYSELPEELQDIIESTAFDFYILKDITDDERDEIFVRQNNGVSLTNMEITRAIASSEMPFVAEICELPFFQKSINLTGKMKNRFVHNEVVMAVMMLLDNPSTGLSGNELKEFAQKIRTNGYSEENKTKIRSAVEYLSEAIPVQMKKLIKVHIPMVMLMAIDAIEMGIPAKQFGGWVQGFFARKDATPGAGVYNVYGLASRSSVAKADNVRKRIESIRWDFNEYARSAEDFKDASVKVDETEDEDELVLA